MCAFLLRICKRCRWFEIFNCWASDRTSASQQAMPVLVRAIESREQAWEQKKKKKNGLGIFNSSHAVDMRDLELTNAGSLHRHCHLFLASFIRSNARLDLCQSGLRAALLETEGLQYHPRLLLSLIVFEHEAVRLVLRQQWQRHQRRRTTQRYNAVSVSGVDSWKSSSHWSSVVQGKKKGQSPLYSINQCSSICSRGTNSVPVTILYALVNTAEGREGRTKQPQKWGSEVQDRCSANHWGKCHERWPEA